MKSLLKLSGIIVIATIIGFTMCPESPGTCPEAVLRH